MGYGTRRPKKGAKKYVRRARKPAAKRKLVKQGLDSVVKYIKASAPLDPGQGVSVANYIRSFVSLQPAASSTQLSWNGNPEARLWRSMYDRFRIESVSIKIVPRANMQSSIGVGGGSQNNSLGMYYVVADRDSAFTGGLSQVRRLKSGKGFSQLKGCRRTYSVKYPKGLTFDTLSDYDISTTTPGVIDQMKMLGIYGGLTIYGENFPENVGRTFNQTWADMEITYKMRFYSYTIGTIQYDPETDLVQITSGDTLASPDLVQPLVWAADPGLPISYNKEVGETPITGLVPVVET